MFHSAENSLHQGAIGLARAIYEYQLRGYRVSIPIVDGQDYDLVIEKDAKFFRVQCKTTSMRARLRNGDKSDHRFSIDLRSIKTNTTCTKTSVASNYDLLFVLCSNGDCYSIPIPTATSIVVGGDKYAEYKLNGSETDTGLL